MLTVIDNGPGLGKVPGGVGLRLSAVPRTVVKRDRKTE